MRNNGDIYEGNWVNDLIQYDYLSLQKEPTIKVIEKMIKCQEK